MRLRVLATSLMLVCSLLFAACDSSSDSTTTGSTATGATAQPADVDWPYFGRVEERTQYIAEAPDPPFHMLWEFFAKQLIEFPPVLQDGHVFIVNKTGQVFVVDAKTGKSEKSFNLGNDVTSP